MSVYLLGQYLGYFALFIITSIIAIICAKKKRAWIWFAIGALPTLLSLIGKQRTYDAIGFGAGNMTTYWFIYFALFFATAIVIIIRYKKAHPDDTSS